MSKQVEIELRDVSRGYAEGARQHAVLNNVSCTFDKGETVAIRGRSGSGKSTLLNLIGAIDAPDQGSVVVAGVDITALNEHDRTLFRRKNVGFVYQAFNLIATLTVADNIRLVMELNDLPRRETDERVAALLEAVGLASRAGSYPDILSGGEQQRVAVARALAHNPPVVLADEPTGNLDDAAAETVLQLLDSLVRKSSGTLLIATHSARVAAFCDRSLELHDGGIVEAGST